MKKREYTTVLIDFKDISFSYCINKSMTKAEFSFTLRDMKLSMRERKELENLKNGLATSLGIPTFIFTLYSSTIFLLNQKNLRN
jgi:hypothetical protein